MKTLIILLILFSFSVPVFSGTAVDIKSEKESSSEFSGYFAGTKPGNIVAVAATPDGSFPVFYMLASNLAGLSLPFGTPIKLIRINGYVTAVEVGGKK